MLWNKKEPIERKPKETLKDIEYKIITNENLGKVYQCKKCQKNFSDTGLVLQHIYHIHKERKYKCETCEKLFFFKSRLQDHLKICNDKKRKPKQILKGVEYIIVAGTDLQKMYQCKRCEKQFHSAKNFFQHFHYVHKEKKIRCAFVIEYFHLTLN